MKYLFLFTMLSITSCSVDKFDFSHVTDEKIELHVSCKNEYLSSNSAKIVDFNTTLSDWNKGLPSCPNFLKKQNWRQVSDLPSSDKYVMEKLTKLACGLDTILKLNDTYTSYYYNVSSGADGWKYDISIKILFIYNRQNNEFIEIRQTGY